MIWVERMFYMSLLTMLLGAVWVEGRIRTKELERYEMNAVRQ